MIVSPKRPGPLVAAGSVTLLTIIWLCTSYWPTLRNTAIGIPLRPSYGTANQDAPSGYKPKSEDEKVYGRDYHGHSTPSDINRVTNSTLGFGKVFVIGLLERSDKRDAVTLASSLTGFDVEWINGVKGESIPDKAVPFGVDRKKLMETNLGSWRGHMNAIRRVVELGLDSALIMEDDMDWDVHLKPQLELVASGTRTLLSEIPDAFFPTGRPSTSFSTSRRKTPTSPYGEDWDILWLGHCGEPFPELLDENAPLHTSDPAKVAMSSKYTILNDPTVPPYDKVNGIVKFKEHPEYTRWVHVTAAPICTFAYAVSQKGAQKILYDLSVNGLGGPFDNALAWLCRRAVGSWSQMSRFASQGPDGEEKERSLHDRGYDAKCLSVTPPLFFHHKAKGAVSGDSDIQSYGGKKEDADGKKKEEMREKGKTENIVWSARLNVENMMMGTRLENQYEAEAKT